MTQMLMLCSTREFYIMYNENFNIQLREKVLYVLAFLEEMQTQATASFNLFVPSTVLSSNNFITMNDFLAEKYFVVLVHYIFQKSMSSFQLNQTYSYFLTGHFQNSVLTQHHKYVSDICNVLNLFC